MWSMVFGRWSGVTSCLSCLPDGDKDRLNTALAPTWTSSKFLLHNVLAWHTTMLVVQTYTLIVVFCYIRYL